MQEQLTYEGFKEFVSNQPEDKTINHDPGEIGEFVGWCGCAVGAYVKTVLGKPVDRKFDLEVQYKAKAFMMGGELPRSLERILAVPHDAQEHCPTYGHLEKFLNKC